MREVNTFLASEYSTTCNKMVVVVQNIYPALKEFANVAYPGDVFRRSYCGDYTVAIFKVKPRLSVNQSGQLQVA
jgi:hypothetical protein